MEIPKFILLICCAYYSLAEAEHSYTIPIENYETELQVLDSHVVVPETPVKVIKITKTVAVKIPVPYPVKVYEKVPYPVHIAKPYPVPVPQIVHLPAPRQIHPKPTHEQEALDVPHGGAHHLQHPGQHQDSPSYQPHADEFHPEQQSFHGNSDHVQAFGSENDGHSDENPGGFHGYSDDSNDNGSYESKRYQAIKPHPHKQLSNGGKSPSSFHY